MTQQVHDAAALGDRSENAERTLDPKNTCQYIFFYKYQ